MPITTADFIVKKGIPILDEHELKGPDGKVAHSITKEKLHRIAANNNKRIRETGDYCPLVIGHTVDGKDEKDQPEIVGYACNFRVAPLLNTTRYAIHADFKFMKDKYGKAKNYPRRSVELWPGREEVDPISLLGATSPERDLGLIHYARHGDQVHYSHTIEEDDMPANPPAQPGNDGKDGGKASDIVQQVIAALEQLDWVKFVKQAMGEQEAQGADGTDGAADADGSDVLPAQPGDAGPAPQPGAAPPSPETERTPQDPKDKEMYSRLQEEKVQLSRAYEEQLAANTNLHLRLARVEREKDLIELENLGVVFDRAEELDAVTIMDEDQYTAHINRMKTRYSRAPVGGLPSFNAAEVTKPNTDKPVTSRKEAEAIAKYAREHNLRYEEAKVKMAGEHVL